MNLTKCPRTLLQRQCITYLGPVCIHSNSVNSGYQITIPKFNLWFGLVILTERETSIRSRSGRRETSQPTKQEPR